MNKIDIELFKEFTKWGSGFILEAERDYKAKGEPLVYHLTMYGLWADDENEFVSTDINVVMKQATKLLKGNMEKYKANQIADVGKKVSK